MCYLILGVIRDIIKSIIPQYEACLKCDRVFWMLFVYNCYIAIGRLSVFWMLFVYNCYIAINRLSVKDAFKGCLFNYLNQHFLARIPQPRGTSKQWEEGPIIQHLNNFFRKTSISYPLIHRRACAYQGVRNIVFLEYFAYILNGSSHMKTIRWMSYKSTKNITVRWGKWGRSVVFIVKQKTEELNNRNLNCRH